MERPWFFRAGLVLSTMVVAAYLLYPSYYYYFEATQEQRDDHEAFCKALPSWMSCKKFNLGLDLQGGVHLVMGVEVERAVQQRTDRIADSLRDALTEAKIPFERLDRPRNSQQIRLVLAEGADPDAVEKLLRKDFSVLNPPRRAEGAWLLQMTDDEANAVRDSAVEQTIKTIRNRADRLGVTEPTIARRGTENVLIQLPGLNDPQRAIDIIGKTAQLEFKIVQEEATAVFDSIVDLPQGVERREYTFSGPSGRQLREVYFELPAGLKDEVRGLLESHVDSTMEVAFGPARLENGAEVPGRLRTYLLTTQAGITGDYLTDASVQQNPDLPSEYYVIMNFDAKGAKIFGDLTEQNVQRHMAIVLDDTVNSAPIIQEKIPGGTARITLGRGGNAQDRLDEAKALSLVLKAGALPAPVEVREQRRVGKTLGEESVQAGTQAITVGGILVLIFMVLWYRGSGVIANVALFLNVVFVLAVLALFEATLTLPGMAGIVLTIGMAVDANVIIYERIKEELRIGKTPRAAIDSGYSRAFSSIMDANITTVIAGVVLMEYGSGPIRGFAVTLIIGVLCSMFTAIVVTRLIYDFFTSRYRLQNLSI